MTISLVTPPTSAQIIDYGGGVPNVSRSDELIQAAACSSSINSVTVDANFSNGTVDGCVLDTSSTSVVKVRIQNNKGLWTRISVLTANNASITSNDNAWL